MRYIDKERFNDCKPINWDTDATAWSLRVERSATPKDIISSIGNKWSLLKPGFINEYGDKCWYSESPRIGTDFDVDHYWPKGRVKNLDGEIVANDSGPHTGYWWKAYDVKNYRYSCIFSNRSRGGGGKVDYFPISNENNRAWTKDCQSDYSFRVILDPCDIEDVKLLSFEIEPGKVHPSVTEEEDEVGFFRVQNSNILLNLDHETIVPHRLEIIKGTKAALRCLKLTFQLDDNDLDEEDRAGIIEAKDKLKRLCDRKSPFSASAIQHVLPFKNVDYLADFVNELDLEY